MIGMLLHSHSDIEFVIDAENSIFWGIANDSAANSVGHKGESLSEQDDRSDIGGNDAGDSHAPDNTE